MHRDNSKCSLYSCAFDVIELIGLPFSRSSPKNAHIHKETAKCSLYIVSRTLYHTSVWTAHSFVYRHVHKSVLLILLTVASAPYKPQSGDMQINRSNILARIVSKRHFRDTTPCINNMYTEWGLLCHDYQA